MFGLEGYEWLLLKGTKLTILVGLSSMFVAIVLGLLGAWGKLCKSKPVNMFTSIYTTVIRGVPELVLILLIFYGVPTLVMQITAAFGQEIIIDFNPFISGVCTIGFIYGAFTTEVFRGAIMAVPRGQAEAAKAMGMGPVLMFRRILLPQLWRFALPGLGNVWMILIKATALISVIQLPELMRNSEIASRALRKPFTVFFAASMIYLVITLLSQWGQQRCERWANRGVRRAK